MQETENKQRGGRKGNKLSVLKKNFLLNFEKSL